MPIKYQAVLKISLSVIAIVIFAVFIHNFSPNISDPDSFYHLRHSWIYKTQGIFNSEFPWAQYSAIKENKADLWYGFHMLLLPLTFFKDLLDGVWLGNILTTVICLLLAYCSFLILKVKYPLFWTFFFTLISADLLYRTTMLRPHPLSLGLAMLLFAVLGSEDRKNRTLYIFIISAVFSWLHLALFWLPPLIVLAINGFKLLRGLSFRLREIISVLLGVVLGWLLRPHPLGAARLAYIQVFEFIVEKQKQLPLRFGRELTPFVWENFVDQLIPISIFMVLGSLFLLWVILKNKKIFSTQVVSALFVCLTLACLFFVLSFTTARRSNELFIAFSCLYLAVIFSQFEKLRKQGDISLKPWPMKITAFLLISILVYAPFKTFARFSDYKKNAFAPERFKEVSLWLKENAQPKEIVFNIHWDRFAQLFFWNPQNYYINGMDPIFEYAYSPELYWKTHFLHTDEATSFTCGKIRCLKDEAEQTYKVLKQDFKASYILVEKNRNPNLYSYLQTDSHFQQLFQTPTEAIFKIL